MTASRNEPTNLPGIVQSPGRQQSAALWDHKLALLASPSSPPSAPGTAGKQRPVLSAQPTGETNGDTNTVGLFPKRPDRHTGRARSSPGARTAHFPRCADLLSTPCSPKRQRRKAHTLVVGSSLPTSRWRASRAELWASQSLCPHTRLQVPGSRAAQGRQASLLAHPSRYCLLVAEVSRKGQALQAPSPRLGLAL